MSHLGAWHGDIMTIRVNPLIEALAPYIPGEQPQGERFIKLNTNENPYPPAPEVTEALTDAIQNCSLQKYPDPMALSLRTAVAESCGLQADQVFAGNGSDEVLRLVFQVFLDGTDQEKVGILEPTYSLYSTLAEMVGAPVLSFPTAWPEHSFPEEAIKAPVKVFFLANPNPPLGVQYDEELLERLASYDRRRLIVVDEAYVAFAPLNALAVMKRHKNVMITRTFSKSFSLAGMRVGLALASRDIIAQLNKAKDSYNLNALSQVAAESAWRADAYYAGRSRVIVENRQFLADQLRLRGFVVPESRGNFVFARRTNAEELYQALKREKILVRWFSAPSLRDGVRITIGTREELNELLTAIDRLV
ncbi:histidinol-phosphate transaminase [candidate division BRC1 bacterium HGW-BRC1-1]|nr:MAG: histidinol-phosphate transaminase [candidate division BRC1 bacterium HGW-BRC1-1]